MCVAGVGFDVGGTIERDEDVEAIIAGDRERFVGLVAVDGEAVAVDEFFEGVIVVAAGVWDDGRHGSLEEVGAGE